MAFSDNAAQGYVYHVINIVDLSNALNEGIRYDDKKSYDQNYYDFHTYFDNYKPDSIPDWVERKKAIFSSISFKEDHQWHSHSAVLRLKINKDLCWVCNENLANFIYEPFILQKLDGFEHAQEYLRVKGRSLVQEYWKNSLSFNDNLRARNDKKEGYDAEVLIMHSIPPEHIECLCIVSDHQMMSYREWQEFFKQGSLMLEAQYNRYLQPSNISPAWKTSGLQ